MYTPPTVEEEEEEAAEEGAYEAQFEEGQGASQLRQEQQEQEQRQHKSPAAPPATTTTSATAVEPEEVKEAPHILMDLPPHVQERVEEVAERGGRCGLGRCRAWLYVLREELRHEEQWRLPVLPRTAFINFKWSRAPAPERAAATEVPNPWFVFWRVLLLVYWSSWVTVAVVGAQSAVHIPPPVYEHLGYNALW